MADSPSEGYNQIKTVLYMVITSSLFNGDRAAYRDRALVITTDISDFSVSAKQVRVHPAWAAEIGPIAAATHILRACQEFNNRVEHVHEATWEEWSTQMEHIFHEVEKRWGVEGLQRMVEDTLGIGNDSVIED